MRVVRTTGRRSGQQRSTPLGVVQVEGGLYLVSPKPGRDWVRNLESHPHLVLDSGEDSRTAVAAEPAQATPAVSAYLRSMRAPWALRAFPVGPDAGLAEIIDHLDIIAVTGLFPITPVTTGWRRKRPLRFRCTRAVRQADGGVQV